VTVREPDRCPNYFILTCAGSPVETVHINVGQNRISQRKLVYIFGNIRRIVGIQFIESYRLSVACKGGRSVAGGNSRGQSVCRLDIVGAKPPADRFRYSDAKRTVINLIIKDRQLFKAFIPAQIYIAQPYNTGNIAPILAGTCGARS